MKILFLDDNAARRERFQRETIGCNVDFATTAQECIKFLNEKGIEYNLIMLDHDLEKEHENTLLEGMEDGRFVVNYIVQNLPVLKDKHIIIHSLNKIGSMMMMSSLLSGGFRSVFLVPFAWSRIEIVDGIFKFRGLEKDVPSIEISRLNN